MRKGTMVESKKKKCLQINSKSELFYHFYYVLPVFLTVYLETFKYVYELLIMSHISENTVGKKYW